MFSPQSASRLAFSYIAASILAMEHFNKRNASVVPELETVHQNCTFYFDRPTIVDTEADGRRAVRQLWRQTVDASTSWPCAVLNPLSAAASTQIVPAIDAFDLPMLNYYREGVAASKQPNTIGLTLSTEGRAKAMVEYFSSLEYLAVWSSFSPFQETFVDVLESNKGSLELRKIRSQSFPTTKDAMRYLSQTGVTTIYCDLATPSEMPLFAEKLDQLRMLDQGKVFVIPPELAPTDSLHLLYPQVEPGTPLDKLLSGALVFDRLDGFRNEPQRDAFLNAWNSQGKQTVRLMNNLVPKTVKYGAAADFFHTEPVNYASYVYDAVMAIGIGGCILEEAKMKLESDSFRFAPPQEGNISNVASSVGIMNNQVHIEEPEPTLPGLVVFEEAIEETVEEMPEETLGGEVPKPAEESYEEFNPFQRFVDEEPVKEEECYQETVVPDWLHDIDTLVVIKSADTIEESGDSSDMSNRPPGPAILLLPDVTEFEDENIGAPEPGGRESLTTEELQEAGGENQGPSDVQEAGIRPNEGTSTQLDSNDPAQTQNQEKPPPRPEDDGFDPNRPRPSGGMSDPPDPNDPPPPPNSENPPPRPEDDGFDPNRPPPSGGMSDPPDPNDPPPPLNSENPPPRPEEDGFDPNRPPPSGGMSDPPDLNDPPPPPNSENSPPPRENDGLDPNRPPPSGGMSDPPDPNDPPPPPNSENPPPRPNDDGFDPNIRAPQETEDPPPRYNDSDGLIPSPPLEEGGSRTGFSDNELDQNYPTVEQPIGQQLSSSPIQPINSSLRSPVEDSSESEPPVTESREDPSLGQENLSPNQNEESSPGNPLSVSQDGQESNSQPLQGDGLGLPLPPDDRNSPSDSGQDEVPAPSGEPSLTDQDNDGMEPEITSNLSGTVEDDPGTETSINTPPNDIVVEHAASFDITVSPTQEVPQSGEELLVETETQFNEGSDLSGDLPVAPTGIQAGDEILAPDKQQGNEVDTEPNQEPEISQDASPLQPQQLNNPPDPNSNPLPPPPRDGGDGSSQARNGQRLLNEIEEQEESVTNLLEAIRKSSFTGASGRIQFGEEPGNERNSNEIPMGLYNIVPGEIDPETNTRTYNTVMVSKFEQERGWKSVPGTSIFHRDASEQAIEFEDNHLSTPVRAIGLTLMGLAWTICLAGSISVYVLRKDAAVQRAQPFFMQLLCCGSFVMSTSIFLLSWDEGAGWTDAQLDVACALTPWFFFSGQIMTFCALFTKLWRVDEVLQFRRRAVSISNVMKPTLGLMCTTFALLVSWTIIEPWTWTRDEISEVPPERYGQCQSSKFWYFFGPLVVLLFFAESLTLYFAWKTADVPEDFRDSGAVFYASFAQLQSWAVGAPMLVVLGTSNADATYFGRIFLIWIFAVSSVVVVVGPKVIKAITIRRNPEKKSSRVRISGLQEQRPQKSARTPLPSDARTASVKFSDAERAE